MNEVLADDVTASSADSSTEIQTVDVTEQFKTACQYALEPGSLCHSSWFTLQHSMSAIEIMDPKMDIRMQGARRVVPVSEALDKKILPLGPFENKQLLGIMDELLASTVNWLTGDSLAQSIFICMYMHCTQLVKDQYLSAFCELLRRSVYQIRHVIVAAGVFDEEDHYAPTHGMPLSGPDPIYDNLENPSPYLSKWSSSQLIDWTNQLINQLSETKLELAKCVQTRLQFVQTLLQLAEKIFVYVDSVDLDARDSELDSYVPLGQYDLDKNKTILNKPVKACSVKSFWTIVTCLCREYQPILKELHELSEALLSTAAVGSPSGSGRLTPKDADYGLPGFEPFLNQTKLPSYIPRFVIIHSRKDAFAYLSSLTAQLFRLASEIGIMASLYRTNPTVGITHLLWSNVRANGQHTCQYMHELLMSNADAARTAQPNLCSCVLSRTFSFFLCFAPTGRFSSSANRAEDPCPSIQMELSIRSWLDLEPKNYRVPVEQIISNSAGFRDYFEVLADQLLLIPRLYCLNRSRQRSALYHCLTKYPELLEESLRIEWIIGVELAERLGLLKLSGNALTDEDPKADSATKSPPLSVPLHLTNFLCYYYYQLAWDYVITGFQLELYGPHEWVFIYTFMIQLFQNLSCLLERLSSIRDAVGEEAEDLAKQLKSKCSVAKEDRSDARIAKLLPSSNASPPTERLSSDGINVISVPGSNRRKAHKKKSKRSRAVKQASGNSNSSVQEDLVPLGLRCFDLGSDFELLALTCHQFLTAATMYAIRALQLDSGGDSVLDYTAPQSDSSASPVDACPTTFGSPVEIYGRRLGIFLLPSSSPLIDPGGIAGAFNSCKRYLTSGIFNASATTELYALAARNFENARLRAQCAMKKKEFDLQSLRPSATCNGPSLLPENFDIPPFGSPDSLAELDRLANHNLIACRVLHNCPERRPQKPNTTPSVPEKCPFLLPTSPVKLEFDSLVSRSYPLIRLVSPLPAPSDSCVRNTPCKSSV
ncbi:unnamed protein product [Calicophoron daubneyi]|uniref:Protein MAK10 homolog n=1 Tax=Calicophoron daubneyi TaxID=300641 RepID=A0AAV2TZM8_CALDB